jgi:hypothetical protein
MRIIYHATPHNHFETPKSKIDTIQNANGILSTNLVECYSKMEVYLFLFHENIR